MSPPAYSAEDAVLLEMPPSDLLVIDNATTLSHRTIVYLGVERYFYLFAPPNALALVVIIHGYGSSASVIGNIWLPLIRNSGLAFLLPEGTRGDTALRGWNGKVCCGMALKHTFDDSGFIQTLVKQVWKTNPSLAYLRGKAFIMGSSNGGFLTQLVALNAERGEPGFEFVAGSITLSGPQWDPALYPAKSVRSAPMLMAHGQNDTAVNFTGCCQEQPVAERCCCDISLASKVSCTSTLQVFQRWKRIHGCQANDSADEVLDLTNGYLLSGSGCQVPTSLAVFPNGGHSLIKTNPGLVPIIAQFIRHNACTQLGGCDSSGLTPLQVSTTPKVIALASVFLASLLLWVIIRRSRHLQQQQWQAVPTTMDDDEDDEG